MNDNVKKWVAALRSGEYKQGVRRLHTTNSEDKFCCLGVACDLYQKEVGGLIVEVMGVQEDRQRPVAYDNNIGSLPPRVQNWLGIKGSYGDPYSGVIVNEDSLSGLNDKGMSFDEIADVIEQEYDARFENAA